MVQFRPAAERGQYDPPVVEDISAGLAADSQAQINAMQRNNAQLDRIARMEIDEARRTTTNDVVLSQLSQFSKTASEAIKANREQTEKDIEIGETWATTFEGFNNLESDLAEEAASQIADLELRDAKATSEVIQAASGSSNLAYSFYRNKGRIGKGLRNEKALLTQAKSQYAPWLRSFKNSDTLIPVPGGGMMPARQLFASDDYSLLRVGTDYARYEFIKQNGLQYTTKKNFVSILNDTLYATEAASNNNTLSTNIARIQGDNIKAEQSNIVNEILATSPDTPAAPDLLQNLWNTSTDNLYLGNTGLSRAGANEKFMEAVVQAALIKGGQAGIDILDRSLNILQNPNNKGSFVGATSAALQVQKAREMLEKQIEADAKDQVQGMYQGAQQIDYTQSNESIAQQLTQQAQAIRDTPNSGQTGAALADALDRKALVFAGGGPDLASNDRDLKQAIISGVPFEERDLDYLSSTRRFSPNAIADARKLIQDKNIPSTSKSRLFINNSVQSYTNGLAQNTGLVFTLQNNEVIMEGTSKLTGVSKNQLKGIATTLNFQMNDLARDVYNSLPTSMSAEEKDTIVKRELDEWYKRNVKDQYGVYNFDALSVVDWSRTRTLDPRDIKFIQDEERTGEGQGQNLETKPLATAQEQQAARTAMRRLNSTTPTQLARLGDEQLREDNQDVLQRRVWYEEGFTPGGPVTPEMKAQASLGREDLFFPLQLTQEAASQYQTTGTYPQYVLDTAKQLNKSPLALLTSQVLAQQRDGNMQEFPLESLTTYQRPVSQQVSGGQGGPDIEQPLTPYEGMQALMAAPFGFPPNGAAFLSGNINTESLWNFTQDPWDDVGEMAGGGISWRGPRLKAVEARYGRRIQDISTYEQLKYMVEEMTAPDAPWFYKEAYDIFMDPRSTRRELIKASKYYWGYGVEGDRYTTADQLLKQYNSNE